MPTASKGVKRISADANHCPKIEARVLNFDAYRIENENCWLTNSTSYNYLKLFAGPCARIKVVLMAGQAPLYSQKTVAVGFVPTPLSAWHAFCNL